MSYGGNADPTGFRSRSWTRRGRSRSRRSSRLAYQISRILPNIITKMNLPTTSRTATDELFARP